MADIQKGNVCKCAHGVVGIIFSIQGVKQKRYHGLTLDGKPWQSKTPTLISETIRGFLITGYNDGKSAGFNEAMKVAQDMVRETFKDV